MPAYRGLSLLALYVIEPENNRLPAEVCKNSVLQDVLVSRIEVDPTARLWRVFVDGCQEGDPRLWEAAAEELSETAPGVESVEFVFAASSDSDVSDATEDSSDNYMKRVLQAFEGPVSNSSAAAPGGPPAEARLKSGRRSRRGRLDQEIKASPLAIEEIAEEEQGVCVQGEIVEFDTRQTRTGKFVVTFGVYDGSDSILCKLFVDDEKDLPSVAVGDWKRVQGNVQYQSFDGELSLMVQRINDASPPPPIRDDAVEKRVELHLHTKMSGMDGTIDVDSAVYQAAQWGHEAVAITDHGVIQAFPEAYFAGKKHGIKIIYGVEGYLVDGEKDRPFHVVLLAKNPQGLKNLYRLISLSHMHHFYRRPRIPRAELKKYREGLIVGSACEAGEVYQAALRNDPRLAETAALYDYLEIQPLGNNEFLVGTEHVRSREDLIAINRRIVALGRQLEKPIVATGDVHFPRPEDALYRTILLAGQGFEDAEHQAPLYFRTTAEMLQEFAYLGEEEARAAVIDNPRWIAQAVEELTPVPQGLFPPRIDEAPELLRTMAYETATSVYGPELPDIVKDRMERELASIIGHGYAPLYWIAHKLVKKSLDEGYLVGSRGSVGSSLVATMCAITEVNPLPPHYVCWHCHWSEFVESAAVDTGVDLPRRMCPHCGESTERLGFDIPFEVFMGFEGDKVPDIDLNFSGEYQSHVHRYTEELFGSDHVFRAGTIGTLADKTAYGFVRKYLEQTNTVKRNVEVNRILRRITGVRRTTGQHPGGMMVVPEDMDVHDFTPIQYPANDRKSGIVTTHFDYHAIHDSLVKLDILGHDDPTALRMLGDLTGRDVTTVPLDDEATMSLFSSPDALGVTEEQIGTTVGTLGIPEFGTRFVRQMLVETRPQTFGELVRISGLSHGTNVWTSNAQELIAAKITDLSNVIACRDDIMVYLIHQGLPSAEAFRIMEQVRKGKGLSGEDEALMKSYDIPDWYIESCQKISYMFPKAHAVAYVMMAFRIAYFKVHFPLEYYATYFSVRAGEFDADVVMRGEKGIREEIQTIEAKGNEATAKERSVVTILEIVLEALARNIEFCSVELYESDHSRFRIVGGRLLPPFAALQGLGVNAAQNIVQARDEGEFSSIEDLRKRARLTKTVVEVLRLHGCLEGMSETNQLTLF